MALTTFPQVALTEAAREYPTAASLLARLRSAAVQLGAEESVAGTSVEGRAIPRYDFGTPGKPVVLLSALMHGVEVIGGLALLEVLEELSTRRSDLQSLLASAHFVVLPVVNPDALERNLARLGAGQRAWQRCNARGVDLNRNFPRVTTETLYHPFSGSRFRWSPHYVGPQALSEPESRAVHDVAMATRPAVSLAFHSFGNLLLYPWAHTARHNPRAAQYRALGAAMSDALKRFPYRVGQARSLYSVIGDMDDWLDTTFGTLAFTVEVSRPEVSLRKLGRLLNPFHWMNPEHTREVVKDLAPGILALLATACVR